MKLRTFYKKLAQTKNQFRWNFGVKDGSDCIRGTNRKDKNDCRCPIECLFDETSSAYTLGRENNIENYTDIIHAADFNFDYLDYKQKRIRQRMLEILKGK